MPTFLPSEPSVGTISAIFSLKSLSPTASVASSKRISSPASVREPSVPLNAIEPLG